MLRRFREASCALRLPLVVAFFVACGFGTYSSLSDRYLHFGMYGLIASRLVRFLDEASLILAGLLVLIFVEQAVHHFAERRGHQHSNRVGSAQGSLTLLCLLYGLFLLNRYVLPGQETTKVILANAALVLAVGVFGFGLHLIGDTRLQSLQRAKGVRFLALAALGIALLLNGYTRLGTARSSPSLPNVIFFGVDTLRADHLGGYGYERDTTPNIDEWAKGATVFEQCITATPRTTQSLASILTARYPYQNGVRDLRDQLPREELSLAEILSNKGYTTVSVIATGIPYKKLDAGFDTVIDTTGEWSAQESVDKAIEQLAKIEGRYFLFLFLRDPHMPYEPARLEYDRSYEGSFERTVGYHPDKNSCVYNNDFTDPQRTHAVALYDSELREVDRQFGRMLNFVREKSRDNVMFFFSDHGESLGEHDLYYDHGDVLHQPGLHVPFIIEGISFEEARISETVRTIDFVPTLLARLGIRVRNDDFEGVDLATRRSGLSAFSETGRALLEGAYTTRRRFLKGLEGRLRALTRGGKRLVYTPTDTAIEYTLFDLEEDPGELHPLEEGPEFEAMKIELLQKIEQDRRNWGGEEAPISEETRQMLRSLGYLD